MNESFRLVYPGKKDEKEILKDQPLTSFKETPVNGSKNNDNQLFYMDNLDALRFLIRMKKEGKMKNPDGTNGIKLIYIDPPFATGSDYKNGLDFAYTSKQRGESFLEFLRERLVLLKQLLTEDGSIYVRIDFHYSHYLKLTLDEIFGEENFKNEILVRRTLKTFPRIKKFNVQQDSLFFYTKSKNFTFNLLYKERKDLSWKPAFSLNERNNSERTVFGKKITPKKGYHWAYSQENMNILIKEGRIRLRCLSCKKIIQGDSPSCCDQEKLIIEYLQSNKQQLDNNWLDIPGYSFGFGYPTSNSEQLLERVILASSNKGEIVLDCFAGSGTTGAVAEKLGRRWIMVDFGELAIKTIKRRLENLKENIGNTGKPLPPAKFTLYETKKPS